MVRTRAMTAGAIYREVHEHGAQPAEKKEPIANGMDPLELGRLVVRAIEFNEPYIFPHGEFVPEVKAYFDEMLAAFPTEFEMDEVRKAGEERRAKMTAEARAVADAL
jgi:hypothetical protein